MELSPQVLKSMSHLKVIPCHLITILVGKYWETFKVKQYLQVKYWM